MLLDLNAIILDPEMDSRTRLRETLSVLAVRSVISFCPKHFELIDRLKRSTDVDLVVVSSNIGEKALEEFLKALSAVPYDTAPLIFIAVHGKKHNQTNAMLYLTQGAHGIISEPYSAEAIASLYATAQEQHKKIKNERKAYYAADLILQKACTELSFISTKRSSGNMQATASTRTMRELRDALEKIIQQIPNKLPELLLKRFENAQPPPPKPEKRSDPLLKKVAHPGEILANMLQKRNLSASQIADKLGMTTEETESFIKGEREVTRELSEKLAHTVGESKAHWVSLQEKYNRYIKRVKSAEESAGKVESAESLPPQPT